MQWNHHRQRREHRRGVRAIMQRHLRSVKVMHVVSVSELMRGTLSPCGYLLLETFA